jgi:pimeloyl-ACP methyl ester carboxylesterase
MGASLAAVQAMAADVSARFVIDPKRIYTAGFSGGARVAMQVALTSDQIAGVIASSAGFPDGQPRKSLPFPVFATAGTEDFNYLEMRRLDAPLNTPHRLVVFEGGHAWLPSEIAVQALEWMEVQAMNSGRRARDEALLDRIFTARQEKVAAQSGGLVACLALEALAADFAGLRDVTAFAARAAAMRRQKNVQEELKKERAEEQQEARMTMAVAELEADLDDPSKRPASMMQVKCGLWGLAYQANDLEDSADRRVARRVLRGTIARTRELGKDPEYQKLLTELRSSLKP